MKILSSSFPKYRTGKPITEIVGTLNIALQDAILYGDDKAKIKLSALKTARKSGRLILVSAITPTPAGEGKTTTTIGLGQGLAKLGESVCLALREPSLGPCLGMKGGATGGGLSQLIPADDINLHFTGDFHAVTSAHNLLAALIDNHIYHGELPLLDPQSITWKRVLDMNDRSLRRITLRYGGTNNETTRESGFDITAASEVMAILCLAENHDDLKHRLERILVGFTQEGNPVTAGDLNAAGAMAALLKDALLPNLVQTQEGVPAFVHGGPFANIAHGCNSVLATRMAMAFSDWAITEAGFGFDLGAEKFFDIKCRGARIDAAAVVLVATCRALKMHGGVQKDNLTASDPDALQKGLGNLDKHVENIIQFGEKPIVCLNHFTGDHEQEIEIIRRHCEDQLQVPFAVSRIFEDGGQGGLDLARAVIQHAEKRSSPFRPLYDWDEDVKIKIWKVAHGMYGAAQVLYSEQAERDLKSIEKLGYTNLPVCIAKTQSSLTDDPKIVGRPDHFTVTVREILIAAGAGFLIPITGTILRMPGLPRHPQSEHIDLKNGEIEGVR